jgi:mono/diheme cytochrome c family protein
MHCRSDAVVHKSQLSLIFAASTLTALVLAGGSSSFGQDQDQERESGGAPSNLWQPGPSAGWNIQALSPAQRQRLLRSSAFINKEVPEAYLDASNDVGYTTKAIAEGGPIYSANCKRCHGETGLGNGALAQDLTPSPALLAYLVQQPIAVDQYLLWSISEGGKQFGTAMPAFKTVLTQNQIWKVIAYLRAGFPAIDDEGAPADGGGTPPVQSDEPPEVKPGR